MSEFATFRAKRSLNDFTAQVTIEEVHTDELEITEHPVEKGASITDHAFKRPARLVLSLGWSNSKTYLGLAKDVLGLLTGNQLEDVRAVYAKLLTLQEKREPFTVTTGKRTYENMLFASLATTTDQKSEESLFVTATLQQIITVQTQTTTVPPSENQASPQKTADTTKAGTKQPVAAKAVNESILHKAIGR